MPNFLSPHYVTRSEAGLHDANPAAASRTHREREGAMRRACEEADYPWLSLAFTAACPRWMRRVGSRHFQTTARWGSSPRPTASPPPVREIERVYVCVKLEAQRHTGPDEKRGREREGPPRQSDAWAMPRAHVFIPCTCGRVCVCGCVRVPRPPCRPRLSPPSLSHLDGLIGELLEVVPVGEALRLLAHQPRVQLEGALVCVLWD